MQWFILILLSALLMGIADIFRKKALSHEHAMQFTTAFMTILFLLSFIFIGKVDFSINIQQILLFALKAALILLAFTMIMKALKHTEISKTAPLRNLSIIFVVTLGIFFLGESLSTKNFIGISALLIGTYLVEINPKIKHHFKPFEIFKNKYSVFILIYLVAISIAAMIDKVALNQGTDIYTYLFFVLFFVAIFSWAIQIIFYKGFKDFKVALKKGKLWIPFAAILTISSDLLYLQAIAIPTVYLSLAIPLRRTGTIISTAIGGKMFHEKNLLYRIIGCVIMIAGIFLILS